VDDFEYFLITEQTGLDEDIDGILGLSMGGAKSTYDTGPLLVEALTTDNDLSANIFSFYLDNINGTSYVDMGYADPNSMTDIDDLVEISMVDHFFWLQYMFAMRFGESPEEEYKFEAEDIEGYVGYSTIFDTGTTLAYVPSS